MRRRNDGRKTMFYSSPSQVQQNPLLYSKQIYLFRVYLKRIRRANWNDKRMLTRVRLANRSRQTEITKLLMLNRFLNRNVNRYGVPPIPGVIRRQKALSPL